MIAVGIQHPGDTIKATVETDLYHGFTAVTNIVFAFCKPPTLYPSLGHSTNQIAGHAAFFHLMAELENPRDYPKALCLLQGIDISLYVLAAVVIYCYAGENVTSPALGSAGPIVSRVAYGIALPTVRSIPYLYPPVTNTSLDRHSRRNLRARRLQIRLRAHLPRHRPHAQTRLGRRELVGRYRGVTLATGVDHRRGDPRVQQSAQSDHGAVRQLVHVRPERRFLAVYELGMLWRFLEEDVSYSAEFGVCGDWGYFGMFSSSLLSEFFGLFLGLFLWRKADSTGTCSVVLVCMSPEKPSMIIPTERVFRVERRIIASACLPFCRSMIDFEYQALVVGRF